MEKEICSKHENSKLKYKSYADVPYYRKQGFFWLTYIILPLVAVVMLACGDVYYQKGDKVKSFGMANRVIAGIVGLGYMAKIAKYLFSS